MSTCPSMALSSCIARVLSARIRELRLDAEMPQSELADRSGMHRPVICRIERGVHVPGLCTLAAIAAALELDVSTILMGIDWREVDMAAALELRSKAA